MKQASVVSVVPKGLPDNFEYPKTVHDFLKNPTPFVDLKKNLKTFADSQKLKDCVNLSTNTSNAAVFVLQSNAMNNSTKCFRCNQSDLMKKSRKLCSICKKFEHSESECFQKSHLD